MRYVLLFRSGFATNLKRLVSFDIITVGASVWFVYSTLLSSEIQHSTGSPLSQPRRDIASRLSKHVISVAVLDTRTYVG